MERGQKRKCNGNARRYEDLTNEAQVVQALIAAGLPKEVVYSLLSFVDDVDYIMQLIEAEKNEVPSLVKDLPVDKSTEAKRQTQHEQQETGQDNKR